MSFSEDGTVLVTSGSRHVKFWSMDSISSKKTEKVAASLPFSNLNPNFRFLQQHPLQRQDSKESLQYLDLTKRLNMWTFPAAKDPAKEVHMQ